MIECKMEDEKGRPYSVWKYSELATVDREK